MEERAEEGAEDARAEEVIVEMEANEEEEGPTNLGILTPLLEVEPEDFFFFDVRSSLEAAEVFLLKKESIGRAAEAGLSTAAAPAAPAALPPAVISCVRGRLGLLLSLGLAIG